MVTKWGFGAAPVKDKTQKLNVDAAIVVRDFIMGTKCETRHIIDSCSRVKGLFNRIVKQDQWDWFTVYMYFDYPDYIEMRRIISLLQQLRTEIQQDDNDGVARIIGKLTETNMLVYLNNYIHYTPEIESDDQFVYILSRREEKELLKIGMTKRNVIKRCNEINSATGVVYPFSPRAVFRVNDAKKAEKIVHTALSQWRVRNDREFFVMDYATASELIEMLLRRNNLIYDKYGIVPSE